MDVTVAAVMTAPRYECTSARTQIEKALQGVGIPLCVSGGVYYAQCMENMLEKLIDEGVQYALTVDFDSIFTKDHVQRLINIVAQEQEIDALAALQPMRGRGRVLGSVKGGQDIVWEGQPLEVDTAHFGLTVIDLAKLVETPKPWFLATPDDRGGWSEACTDSDVHFWRNWTEAGHSVYLDPGTRLGHLEELVTYFDPEMNLQHQYFREWEAIAQETVD